MSTRTLILGTAGHIDHGKTALIRALTGIDTDRLPQEKQRGITIDIGFARLDLGETRVGIVDVPGHERFIKNMLAGASGIDVGLLVVAADDSVMPQTREHLAILNLLNIKHGVIALSKVDLAEPSWTDLVEEEVRELVEGSFLEGAPIVRTSAAKGAGIDDLRTALTEVCSRVPIRDAEEPFRLAVDRSFVGQGVGTIVTGSVNAGRLRVDEQVEQLPAGGMVRVRSLQSHGREVDEVHRGERAAINLTGVHHTEIGRGGELATPGYLRPSRLMSVRLDVLESSPFAIRHRARLRLHVGTAEIIAGVRLLEATVLQPGESGYAQLVLSEPAASVAGQPFVVRAESPLVTVGGGHVLQPVASRIKRRDAGAIERLEQLNSDDERTRASAATFYFGTQPWSVLDLVRDAGVSPGRAGELIDAMTDAGDLVSVAAGQGRTLRVHRDVLADLEDRICRALRRMHDRSPLEPAVPRPRTLRRFRYLEDDALVNAVLDRMIGEKRLVGDENAVALPDFRPRLSNAQQELYRKLIDRFEAAGFTPPAVPELSKELGVADRNLRQVLDLCVRSGELAHLGGPLYMHREHEAELRRRVCEKLAETSGLAVSEIRDLFGTSRKYVLPMCEYLDRVGVTKRVGDVRVLSEAAAVER